MDALTAAHRRQLIALRARTITELRLLWPAFDPNRPETWDRFAVPAATLLGMRHAAARALGVRYYTALRVAKLGLEAPVNEVTLPAAVLSETQVARSMAATGLAGTFLALRSGKPLAAALDNGFARTAMAGSRLVLNGSRDAVRAAAQADGRASGWIRQTGGKPCSWCASKEGVHMTSAEVFQAHDGCSCVAEPAWA